MKNFHTRALPAFVLLSAFAASAVPSAQVVTYSSSWASRPVIRIAQNYYLGVDETVSDVRVVFGDATIEGRVEGDVVVVFGTARLQQDAVVEGTLVVVAGSAEVAPATSIERDVVVVGGTLTGDGFARGGDQVVVGSAWLGSLLQGVVPWMARGLVWGRLIVPDIGWVWAVVGIFFLLYLALNVVFTRAVGATADALSARPISTFMAGLLVLLLSVPLMAILLATVIGVVLLPFILCALVAAGLLGKAAVARALGRTVLPSGEGEASGRAVAAFVAGFALLTIAYMIPVLGFVTWALTTVMGFGAATATLRAMRRTEQPQPPAVAQAPAVAPVVAQPPPAASDAYTAEGFVPTEQPPVSAPLDVPPAASVPVAPAAAAPRVAPPASGLSGYPLATFLDRLAAFALDCLLVAIAAELSHLNHQDGMFMMLLLVYHIAFWTWRGTTMGGIIVGLRVIRTHGADLRPADAIVRGLSSIFSLAALGIGCFWMINDPQKQTWHDKIAGTLVVKVPRDQVLP